MTGLASYDPYPSADGVLQYFPASKSLKLTFNLGQNAEPYTCLFVIESDTQRSFKSDYVGYKPSTHVAGICELKLTN